MKVILTYDNEKGEANMQGTRLKGMSEGFRRYVEDIKRTYERHMKKLNDSLMLPKGKLEIELTVAQNEDGGEK